MSQTISSAISWWSRTTPDTVAINLEGDQLSYLAYDEWGDRVAVELIAMGLKPGDRVGVSSSNSMAYCALVLGVIRAGAIMLPINVRLTPHEVGEIVEDTTPTFFFADTERQTRLAGAGVAIRHLDAISALRAGARQVPRLRLDPDAAVAIITTSGSTAKPKGVMYSNRSMVSCASEFGLHLPMQGGRALVLAPLSTSAGFFQLITYTTLGYSLFVEPVFDAERCLDLIIDSEINVFAGVPIFVERIAACARFAQADLSKLRLVTVGGAAVNRTILDIWIAKGVAIRQMYGQTEVGGFATIMPAAQAVEQPDKCGRGGIFTEIRIMRDDGQLCATGEHGEIVLNGPGMMLGYWNNPTATADVMRDGWLHTGDIGMLDADGFLTFVDRQKDIIISGGINISAAEVERTILAFDGIEEVVVIAAADQKFGETPMAVIYATRPIEVDLLVAFCSTRLADYKVPRYVVVLDAPLPRLATGKLSKIALRKQYQDAATTLRKVR